MTDEREQEEDLDPSLSRRLMADRNYWKSRAERSEEELDRARMQLGRARVLLNESRQAEMAAFGHFILREAEKANNWHAATVRPTYLPPMNRAMALFVIREAHRFSADSWITPHPDETNELEG